MTPVLVIGGGPAGAAAACRLAAAGRAVTLVERTAGAHDSVCGEFVSADTAQLLAELGIAPDRFAAPRLDRVLLGGGGRIAAARLPFAAWGLSRRCLDQALLARAAEVGAEIRRGVAVRRLASTGQGWRAELADGRTILADAVILATGKHDLPGFPRPRRTPMIAFKSHLADAARPPLAGAVALLPFRGGYAGLQPVEDGRVNLCLTVSATRFAALGRSWPGLLAEIALAAPALADALLAPAVHARPLAVAGMPYGHVRRHAPAPGLVCVGDQAAVIPSFTGDGLAIALLSGRIAALGLLDAWPAEHIQCTIADAVRRPMAVAQLLAALAGSRLGRQAIVHVAGPVPGLLSVLAGATRVPGTIRQSGAFPW